MNLGRDEVLSQLRQMDEYEFEQLVADVWEQLGWETTVTTGSSDRGIDVIARKSSPFKQKQLIQVKRYSAGNKIGSPDIQQYSSLRQQEDDVDAIIVVTTSSFTSQAEQIANDLNVKLIDGINICEMILSLDSQRFLSDYFATETTSARIDGPYSKTQAKEIEKAFFDPFDVDVDLLGRMAAPENDDGMEPYSEITVKMSDWANETVRNGFGFFALDRNLPDYFGESEGSSNVTGQVLEKDLSVRNVIAILAENGDLNKASEEIYINRAEDDPTEVFILAYMFLRYSRRWDAEKEGA